MGDHKLSPSSSPGASSGKTSPAVSPTRTAAVVGQNPATSPGSGGAVIVKPNTSTGSSGTATLVRPRLVSHGSTGTATVVRPHLSTAGSTGTTTVVRPHLTVSVPGPTVASPTVVRPHLAVIQRSASQAPYSVSTPLPMYAHQQVLLQSLPHATIAVPQQIQGMASPPLRSPTANQPGTQPSIAMLQQVCSAAGPILSVASSNQVSSSSPSTVANLGSLTALTATVNALQPTVTSVPNIAPGGPAGKFPGKNIVIGTNPLAGGHGKVPKPMIPRHGIRGPAVSPQADPKQHVIITTQTPIFVRPQRQPAITAQTHMQSGTIVATTFPRQNIATVMVPPQTSVRHLPNSPHGPSKPQQQIVVTAQSLGHHHNSRGEKRTHVQPVKHLPTATQLTIPNPAKFIKVERASDLKYPNRQPHGNTGKQHKKPEPTKVHPQPQAPPLLLQTVTPTPTSTQNQQQLQLQQQQTQQQHAHNTAKADEPSSNQSTTSVNSDQPKNNTEGTANGNHGQSYQNNGNSNSGKGKENEDGNDKEQHPDEGEKQKEPQKAIVRPQILTHIIEGFVIEEAKEPFPVSKSSLADALTKKSVLSASSDQESDKVAPREQQGEASHHSQELLKCEFCGKMDISQKFKRSKRFCSMACAKRYNVGCSKRLGLFKPSKPNKYTKFKMSKKMAMNFKTKGMRGKHGRLAFNIHEERLRQLEEESPSSPQTDSSPSPETPPNYDEYDLDMDVDPVIVTDPKRWSVEEVADFIRSLPGCSDYANEFQSQEIDGQALLLLKEDHLMSAMNMKLGPALKICAKINALKE
ncbi:polyhomeotic-like protein 2 isoform X2 [Ptychodera flava]|uniref:polyhomeotic-like protein 2 isoform X2 n=1 Tax=Ptychodera flava TaxID=63121 RepID=UPI00396A7882